MSIVTAERRGSRHGTTITAAMSLSLDPVSIILSLHRGGDWHGGPGEPPMLRDASAVLQCDLAEAHAFGTHAVLLCTVRHVRLGPDREALVYAYRQYGMVSRAAASTAPTDQGI